MRVISIFCDMARVQGFISSTMPHVVYAFLVATLIGLLQMKYQNKSVSPFETHSTNMTSFVLTLCAYCLAMVGKNIHKNHGGNYTKILGHVILISQTLSSVSLATIFLPLSLSSLIMFIVWATMFAIVGRYLFKLIYQWFYWRIAIAVVQVLRVYTRFMGHRLMEQQHFLV